MPGPEETEKKLDIIRALSETYPVLSRLVLGWAEQGDLQGALLVSKKWTEIVTDALVVEREDKLEKAAKLGTEADNLLAESQKICEEMLREIKLGTFVTEKETEPLFQWDKRFSENLKKFIAILDKRNDILISCCKKQDEEEYGELNKVAKKLAQTKKIIREGVIRGDFPEESCDLLSEKLDEVQLFIEDTINAVKSEQQGLRLFNMSLGTYRDRFMFLNPSKIKLDEIQSKLEERYLSKPEKSEKPSMK